MLLLSSYSKAEAPLSGTQGPVDFRITAALPTGITTYASVEAAYEMKDKTPVIVASAAEVLSPGFQPIYASSLRHLFSSGEGPETFARAYCDYWTSQPNPMARSATISVIKTEHLDQLASVTGHILFSAAGTTPPRDDLQHFNRNAHKLFFDLDDYISRIASPLDYTTFSAVLAKAVPYRAATPYFMQGDRYGFPISHHCGLSIYIPLPEYQDLNSYHAGLSWSRQTAGEY